MSSTVATAAPSRTTIKPASRLLSIDLLRGLTIAFMILVNNNGDERHAFWALKHAEWNGFTPTDLVFPTFLLLVGVSVVLATQSRLARGATHASILGHAFRRLLILLALGLIVNSFPYFHLDTMRFYGVLQRIGVCYFIAVCLELITPDWRPKVAVFVACLLGYWALMRFVPVPGYGVPTETVPLLDPNGNLVAWVDRALFSSRHLYERVRDPEGLLSTLPAVGTILIGVVTGIWIRTQRALSVKIAGIAGAGTTFILLGALWNISFPINKKLWTSSYVLFAGGCSLLLLSLAMWIVDMRGSLHETNQVQPRPDRDLNELGHPRALRPLLVFGVNSIAAYFFSEILPGINGLIRFGPAAGPRGERATPLGWYYVHLHHLITNPAVASLLFSLTIVLICWIPISILYRRRIFIRI